MSFMDAMKDQTGDMSKIKERFHELKAKEQSGDLDDKGKQELTQIREKLGKDTT